jgi:hypothetical protein
MSFIKFSYGPSIYSVSFRKPDRLLGQSELAARQQREQGLPAGTTVTTTLKGWVKVKETPRQRQLQTAARAANQLREAAGELGATAVRAGAESGSNASTALSLRPQSMQNPPRPGRDKTALNEAGIRSNTPSAVPASSPTTSDIFPRVQTWLNQKPISDNEPIQRRTLIDRCFNGINSGKEFDLDMSDLLELSSLPAPVTKARNIKVRNEQFTPDIINALGTAGVHVIELEPGSVPGSAPAETQRVPASRSGVDDAHPNTATDAVPMSNRDRLGAALNSWINAENTDAAEFDSRSNVAQNLMKQVADADLSRGRRNKLRLRITADINLPASLAAALGVAGISIDRIPAAGSSGTGGGVQGESRPYPIEGQGEPGLTGINAGGDSTGIEGNPDVHGPTVPRSSKKERYLKSFDAWCEEEKVPHEEVTRRRQSYNELKKTLIEFLREVKKNPGHPNLDLRNLENFSSLPPILKMVSRLTVRPNQFPEAGLQFLRGAGITIDVREASALTASERDSWIGYLQAWTNLGNEEVERKDRATAGTRILAFLEKGNLNETLELSGLNISDLPNDLCPAKNPTKFVQSVNLSGTNIPEAITDFLRANGITFSE